MGKCSSRNNPAWLPAAALPVSSLSHVFRQGEITASARKRAPERREGRENQVEEQQSFRKDFWFVGRQGERQITGKNGPVGVQALSQEEAREKCLKLKPRPQSPADWQWLYKCTFRWMRCQTPTPLSNYQDQFFTRVMVPSLEFLMSDFRRIQYYQLGCQIKLNPKRKSSCCLKL